MECTLVRIFEINIEKQLTFFEFDYIKRIFFNVTDAMKLRFTTSLINYELTLVVLQIEILFLHLVLVFVCYCCVYRETVKS